MTTGYTFFADLAAEVTPPDDGTLSRTLYSDDRVKIVVFGFSAGQELSEHTAAVPAILHVLDGEATLTLAGKTREAASGTWVHMPPHLPHSVRAQTATRMLLIMLKGGSAPGAD
jgi:quercetin dioxygenase-like cupin family protein